MTPQTLVDVLNDALAADRAAVTALVEHRVPCNAALENDCPTVTTDEGVDGVDRVGLLGFVNAFAAAGGRVVEAVYDDESLRLVGFRLRPPEPPAPAPTPAPPETGFDRFPLSDGPKTFEGNTSERI